MVRHVTDFYNQTVYLLEHVGNVLSVLTNHLVVIEVVRGIGQSQTTLTNLYTELEQRSKVLSEV